MSQYTGNVGAMHVSGSFNGWSGTANPMTDGNGDGIYEATVNILPGSHEYKFTMNDWAVQENFSPGGSCTVTTGAFTNRALTVSSAATLPVVCWQSCDECPVAPPATYMVTFKVNMSQYEGTFTNVYVSGTLNNWSGDAWMLTNMGNGIYGGTWSLLEGMYEFKFTVDNWTDQESFEPGTSCTMTTGPFTNRVVSIGSDVTLPTVCWESCADCACAAPVYFTGTVTNTTANVFWVPVEEAVSYRVQYRPVGAARWLVSNVTTTSADLVNLHYGANYEYRVKANCSEYGKKKFFVTSGTPACTTPPTTGVSSTSSSVTINWAPVPDALGYSVQYRQTGLPPFVTLNSPATATSRTITGLMPGTMYDVRVRTRCAAGSTKFGVISRVTTTSGFEQAASVSELSLVPNPAQKTCRIVGVAAGLSTATVLDASGRVVLAQALEVSNELPLHSLGQGVYFIVVEQEGQAPQHLRLVKQ
jgi:hypothetical protein